MKPAAFLLLTCSLTLTFAQEPLPSDTQVPMTSNQIAEARQADEYFKVPNYTEALPLYEDLAGKVPMKAVYAERLAVCLINKAGALPAGPEKDAIVSRYISELKRAKSLGDNSELVQIMLDKIRNAKISPSSGEPKSEATTQMEAAGIAFAKGDMETALAGYKAAFLANPQLYDAPLFAGDVYFRQKNYAEAGVWFQKAIDLNPDRETAYRYWADALVASGNVEAAEDKYIDAIVAEPYAKAPGLAFQRWAKKNGVSLSRPSVPDTNPADPACRRHEPSPSHATERQFTRPYEAGRREHAGTVPSPHSGEQRNRPRLRGLPRCPSGATEVLSEDVHYSNGSSASHTVSHYSRMGLSIVTNQGFHGFTAASSARVTFQSSLE
jgi:hypothetical protein